MIEVIERIEEIGMIEWIERIGLGGLFLTLSTPSTLSVPPCLCVRK